MSYKALENLRDTMCTELDNLSKEKTVTTQSLEQIHKLTDIIKNIDKIMNNIYNHRKNMKGEYDEINKVFKDCSCCDNSNCIRCWG